MVTHGVLKIETHCSHIKISTKNVFLQSPVNDLHLLNVLRIPKFVDVLCQGRHLQVLQ